MIGDSPSTGRFLAVRSAGSEVAEHRIRRPSWVRVGALYYIRTTTTHWTSAKLVFSVQGFWALSAPRSHYVGTDTPHRITPDSSYMVEGVVQPIALALPPWYIFTSGHWGVPLTQVRSHLLSNSIDNQDGQLPRSRYNRVGCMFVTLLVVLS
jgi:hypothetical protein